ncbi:heme-binding protein [Mycobacterium sp. 21AC1]|uniref:hemophore-related protein n=1 Tax=[Mycobacterium] appelbergii TaxID=2939269 RepID=UPI0029393435|nr:hemophore-related protein [Mycobacterium sp. 21AC1]MDV3128652.1 heme-binding protein [Mycobacterium sp. 21AC1]
MQKMSARTVRRCLYGMCAGGVVSAAFTLPMANAAPDACQESGVAGTVSTVTASTSTYLAANPQVDQALTDIARQTDGNPDAGYRTYFENNPQVASELRQINHPVAELSARCGVDVTPTPVSKALQGL